MQVFLLIKLYIKFLINVSDIFMIKIWIWFLKFVILL